MVNKLFYLNLFFSFFFIKDFAQDLPTITYGFKHIPDSIYLSTYWYWINGNISKEGVVKDLASMSKLGIRVAYIGNIGLSDLPGYNRPKISFFSKAWWEILRQAFHAADSLKMKLGLFNSPGWSQSGGPWIKMNQSMRYVSSVFIRTRGPRQIQIPQSFPDSSFNFIAALAIPSDHIHLFNDTGLFRKIGSIRSNLNISGLSALIDGDTSTHCVWSNLPDTAKQLIFDIAFKDSVQICTLSFFPITIPFKSDVQFFVKEDNIYKNVIQFHYDRTKFWRNLGFIPSGPVVVSFPTVTGKDFRIIFSHFSHTGGLSEIAFSRQEFLPRFIEKQLGKMYQYPHPMWDAYKWPASPEPENSSGVIPIDSILHIKPFFQHGDTLNLSVPDGDWYLQISGMLPTGVTNSPATPEATGLEVDKMNPLDVKWHFKNYIERIIDSLNPSERSALHYVVADSYETGSEDWTDDFATAFQKKYGYNPILWLPVLNGLIVGSADQSDRFLWDLRREIADRISYQYVGTLRKMSHEHGLRLWLENYGHWGFPGEFLQYGGQSDDVSGEFWAEGDLGDIELKDASSAAHIYGKNKVFAESFTAAFRPFQRYPDELKRRVDWAFTQGINDILLHVYISQPADSPLPGPNAPFGTEFNRNNIWFNHARAFFDYMRRCMFMLQQGKPVIDVAYFIGEDVPVMTGIRKPELPDGYDFDWINAEVIEKYLTVKNHRLVLPDGMSYRILVLPPLSTMRPNLLKKIGELVKEGAIIVGPPPVKSPSLQNYPLADSVVRALSKKIWQQIDGKNIKFEHYGKGMVFYGMPLQKVMDTLKCMPDFTVANKKNIIYTHRKTSFADIYFISNQSDDSVRFKVVFRTSYRYPQWWDPLTGKIEYLSESSFNGKSNILEVFLYPHQSGFIVFSDSVDHEKNMIAHSNFLEPELYKPIKGNWEIKFDVKFRGPSYIVNTDSLKSWTEFSDSTIKYYSGVATYYKNFYIDSIPLHKRIWLDLGRVNVIAHVKINQHIAGDVWTYPYRVDVTPFLKQGINHLEVTVVNTWVNRLIGDSRLPDSLRFTHTFYNPYKSDSTLQPSGLLGPVNLVIGDVRY